MKRFELLFFVFALISFVCPIILFAQSDSYSLTLIAPNGSEIWAGASNQIIKWRTDSTNFSHYRLLLSRNSGATYPDTIAHNIASTETTYTWLVPSLNLTSCRVMVQILDTLNNVLSQDASDADFTIDAESPTAFNLVSPANGTWSDGRPIFSWTASSDNLGFSHYQLFIDGGLFVDSIPVTSTDLGAYWTQATSNASWSARSGHTSVVFDNKIWVMGGIDGSSRRNDVWYSSDGVNWIQATANAGWSIRNFHTSVVFNNKIWVIGGYDASSRKNDVWYSSDGVNWTQATSNAVWSARSGHTSVVFDNKIWVIGGIDFNNARVNDVWYSSDGINWIQAAASAGWSARYDHSATVFNSKIWVMGGNGASGIKNDVWYSSNGVSWTQATASAAWSTRNRHTSVAFNNKLWVMAGYDASYKRDVWYSSNGVNWTQATASASWSARFNHTSVVFNNKMWMLGGYDASYKRDVWYSSVITVPRLAEGWRTWFIRAVDRAGNTRQSIQTYSIRVDTMPPVSFNLISPTDSFFSIGLGLNYTWQASSDAGCGLMKYQLWIDDNLNRDNIPPSQTSTTHLDSLSNGIHTWHIRAIDSVGNIKISNQIRVIIIQDITPVLKLPLDSSWTVQRQPRFTWQGPSRGVSIYQLYIDNILNQDSIYPPDTSAIALNSLADGPHAWYMRAYDSLGYFRNSAQTWLVKIDSTPPISFNLVSPRDSSLLNLPTPTLTWRKSSDAGIGFKKYEVWINNNRVADSLAQNDTTYTTALTEGYHDWFIKVFDKLNNTRNSNQTFTVIVDWNPPDTFSLASPVDNETTASQVPRLYWHPAYDAVSGIRKYQLWINGVINQESIPVTDTSALPIARLPNNSNNVWFIKAVDKAGGSRASNQTWRFIVKDTIPPTPPELLTPANNAYVKDTMPRFFWRSSFDLTGINYYQLQYAIDSSFLSGATVDVYDTTYQVLLRLLDTTYYWRVRANDFVGNWGDWSLVWQFEIDSRIPSMPILIEPSSNAWFNNTDIAFQWGEVSFNNKIKNKKEINNFESLEIIETNQNLYYQERFLSSVTYILQADSNRNFTTPLVIDTTDIVQDTITLSEGVYFWRVKAYDLAGNQGAFSNPDSFGIDLAAPSVPNLVAPDSGLLTNALTMTFTWLNASDNLSGVRFYTLEYATTPLFLNPILLSSIVDTTCVSQTLADSIYYWRVRTTDWAENTGDWSLVRTFRIYTQIPAAPNLVAPTDSLIANDSTINFIWQTSVSPIIDFYTLEYSRDPLFTIYDSIIQSDTTVILTLADTTYYWRVNVIDSAGNQSPWSWVWSFEVDTRAPNPPTLISPVNGHWLADTLVIFNWSSVFLNTESPVFYILQADSTTGFTNPLTDTTSFVCDTLILGEHSYYYWRIRTYDLAGNQGIFSIPNSFGIDLTVPSVSELISPIDSLITNNPVFTFVWHHAFDSLSGIMGYILEYASNPDFTNPVDTIATDSCITLTLTDTTYYWRIKAHDRASNQSEWSLVRTFDLDSRAPEPPILISPISGTWLNSIDVIFNWSQVTLNDQTPVWYILQFDTSRNFTNPIIDTTALNCDTFVLDQARYFWQVSAYDSLGNQGVFSSVDSFGIDYAIPGVPDLIAPANSAILTDTFVTFIWHRATDNVSGVRYYQLQIASNSSFNNPSDTTLADTTYFRRLSDTTTYFWRVKATDYANNQSNWSSVRNFRVQTTPGIEEILDATKPIIFSLIQNSPNPFSHLTEIRYGIPFTTRVKITVFNTIGKEVITLSNGIQNQGWYSIRWNGRDNKGRFYPNGIYFYRLETEEYQTTRKMLMLK